MRISKISTLAATAAASLLALSGTAQAQSGTINFEGFVVANTCNVQIGGSSNLTVTLQPVLADTLAGVGTTSAPTPFQLNLTGCDTALNGETAALALSGGGGDADGRLANNATQSPSNARIQLLNSNNGVINLVAAAGSQNIPTQAIANGQASFNLQARYISTALITTPGKIASTVNYSITYQ